MNIKETRDLAERVWSMEPPAKKEVALALLEACDSLDKLHKSMEIDMDDGMSVVSLAGDPLLADVVKAAWPSHLVGTPVLQRAVEMLEDHPRLEHRLSDAMLQVRALQGANATLECQLKKIKIRGSPSNLPDIGHPDFPDDEDQRNG